MKSHSPRLRATDISLAYGLLRLVIGINYFNHGVTRLGNIPGFMDAMASAMADAWMPEVLVRSTAALVPLVELLVGLCLILGLFTRTALVVTFILMAILMYGVTVVQNWDAAASQLIYTIVLFMLLAGEGYNRFTLTGWLRRRRQSQEMAQADLRDSPMRRINQMLSPSRPPSKYRL
ncbi:hypothetical protein XM38_045260 [Halomicronema hongdechloris C2206]|uniref:DoxX family protein n=1 Tax=Halomicronema hongdechloris C2206 TaxID=1641165 RepID=A0A1Z3HTV5_9CYAN|nr:DoxX family membrane protein [Halomicronema hongdechloris]ASC73557.1 hypothetical protein XM38_045260 [Halomicronema hongdechloris C2206]